MRRKVRSWLYQVDQSATTIWERWDAIYEDGSIHKGQIETEHEQQEGTSMISFNHYAYGAVIDWVYRNVAGIAPTVASPGYRHITFAPRPGEGFSFASAKIDTPLGIASIKWEIIDGANFAAKIVIPFGARGVLDLPVTATSLLRVNGVRVENKIELGFGSYEILLSDPDVIKFNVL
jgi:alpha-L-rhamnosidase